MKGLLLPLAALAAAPATAQAMDHAMHGMHMPGMTMPAKPQPKSSPKPARPRRAAIARPAVPHDHAATPGAAPAHAMDHAGHDMAAMPSPPNAARVGTDLPPGDAPAPLPRPGQAAAAFYGRAAMAAADRGLRREHGGMTYYQLLFNLAEYRGGAGRDGYRWDGEAWLGGDVDRATIKTEGDGAFGGALERGEVQALYSHAVGPYWNLQAGLRYDAAPGRDRAYATLGVEGLAPYWFDVEGALFVSGRGDVLARAEAWYDQRLTQFVVLQPRVEANLAAQDVMRARLGAGLTDVEAGLRVRYERSRAFAPYVGLSWERRTGRTARFARRRGEDTGGFDLVAGVRAWF